MKTRKRVAVSLVVLALVAGTVLYGQVPGDNNGSRRAGPGGGSFSFDPERTRMSLELMGLQKSELEAAVKSAEVKWKARQALEEARGKLRLLADDSRLTDAQLTQGITDYKKAMGTYQAVVQKEDTALSKKLSVRNRARCLAAGTLDNGLGFSMRRGGGGGGGRGGAGGGPGGERSNRFGD